MEALSLNTEIYKYTALETRSSFRLLKLLKGSSPDIECELYPCSLQDRYPSYEALSYTWGGNEVVEFITLNQKPFWITDNLHSVLQSLRLRDRDRILWIDAICINQGDKFERSQQVKQMGQIYEQAEKVLFWLGKATPQIIALMETLNHCRKISPVPRNMQETLKNWPHEDHSIACQQLLHREWFTRVWIIQEAAKAQEADICCGIRSIPAELFVLTSCLMKQEPPPHCKPVLQIMAESLRKRSWWAEARDLRILLHKFHASKATDERDKIYALLGMSSDPLDIQSLTIDYQKPTSQVAHEAITHLIRSRPDSQSKPLAVHEILNLMKSFTTLDFIYFVPAVPQEDISEVIFPSLQSGYMLSELSKPKGMSQGIAAVNNPALFLVEERSASNLEDHETCYSQVAKFMLDQLSSKAPLDRKYGNELQMYPWGSMENHVKVVVIHDKKDAILKAAVGGYGQVARQLLHMKIGIRGEEECETLVLQKVVAQGGTKELRSLLIDAGANVNAQGGKLGNALQAAAYSGELKAIRILLDAGADVNAQGGEYGNALQAALRASIPKQVVEIVKILLDAGADVNAQSRKYANPLYAAINDLHGREVQVVKMLLDAGADVNAQGGEHGTALRAAHWRLKKLERFGRSFLMKQKDARRFLKQVIKILVDAGADSRDLIEADHEFIQ